MLSQHKLPMVMPYWLFTALLPIIVLLEAPLASAMESQKLSVMLFPLMRL